ncbi:hypothetical protein HHK36_005346 [Tetracentron sinense]|uniref:Uncharacterized protein n=1 Tax=Tetracentron sinense TaxID=13715 RepID=A0A834ZN09_TETSI|nr:hypothetical protein HHK36_005346 [Tetracentron sinense]
MEEDEAVFDSSQSAAAGDGLFSDFEQSEQDEASGSPEKETVAIESPATTIPFPSLICEKQNQPFLQIVFRSSMSTEHVWLLVDRKVGGDNFHKPSDPFLHPNCGVHKLSRAFSPDSFSSISSRRRQQLSQFSIFSGKPSITAPSQNVRNPAPPNLL